MDTVKGIQRVRLWPRKRGPGKTPAERKRAEDFRIANQISKYLPAIWQTTVAEAVRGTPLMPRDLLISYLYGRLFAFGMADGRKVYHLVARRDISDSLDVLAQIPGMILFRDADIWRGLEIGDPTQVLSVDETGLGFAWVTPSGGGGQPWWWNPPLAAHFPIAVNDGTAPTLTDDADAGLILSTPNNANTDATRGAVRAFSNPAADWSLEFGFDSFYVSAHFPLVGLALTDAALTKAVLIGWDYRDGGILYAGQFNLPGGYAGFEFGYSTGVKQPNFFKVEYVAATQDLHIFASNDAKTWVQWGTWDPHLFLGGDPANIGPAVKVQNTGDPIQSVLGVTVTRWTEGGAAW